MFKQYDRIGKNLVAFATDLVDMDAMTILLLFYNYVYLSVTGIMSGASMASMTEGNEYS